MIRKRSLRTVFSWWFAGTLLVLYGAMAVMIWLYASSTARRFALLTLTNEAEEIAAYVERTGRFDAPEFDAPEEAVIPIWIRAVRDGGVVAETPGTPPVPISRAAGNGIVSLSLAAKPSAFMIVRRRAGAAEDRTAIEAIGSLDPLIRKERALGAGLALVGLVVIPLAFLVGRALARRVLRPIAELVRGLTLVDSSRFDERARLPEGPIAEVALLAGAFNDLLGRLEAYVATMRRFTADASHEIRNPLSVLRAGLEVALRRDRTTAEYRQLLTENVQEIERLQAVVEGLLAMARDVPGSPYPLACAPVDLSVVVSATLERFAVVAAERSVALDAAIEPAVTVQGDATLLRLVAFNLVDNALKHGHAGESVNVALTRTDDGARLVVADRGPGVPNESRALIFERFFRGDPEGPGGGGGLGLSVARWVVDLHGGTIRLLEAPRGATFEVTLPARPRASQANGLASTRSDEG